MQFPTAYQPSVDGLRAVSIISVVAFHAGVPGFSGGFVGVDIFFVISGYLIINQILAALQAGGFSFGDFWARRVLRILPPFLLVILVSTVAAGVVLVTPGEFEEFGREARSAALMIVNFHFYAGQGYFDTAAELKPLLHLWTLAVEEQFYLLAPLLLFALWALTRKFPGRGGLIWLAVAGGIFLGSLVGCIAFSDRASNPPFYLTPFRAWEFVTGGALPLFAVGLRRLPRWAGEMVGVTGLALIGYAVFGFNGNTLFPSFNAVLPVLGGGSVILAALSLPSGMVARALATRPMVSIGLVSYSWYLWHWPALAFIRIAHDGDKDLRWDVAAALFALALAAATYIYLERPIRLWRRGRQATLSSWRIVSKGAGAAAAVAIVGQSLVWLVAPIMEVALKPSIEANLTSFDGIPTTACWLSDKSNKPCQLPSARDTGALIGDSHAGMIFRVTFAQAYRRGANLAIYVAQACQPLVSLRDRGDQARLHCSSRVRNALDSLRRNIGSDISFAVLAGLWHINVAPDDGSDLPKRVGEGQSAAAGKDGAFVTGLMRTIEKLRATGARRILLVGPTPAFRHAVPHCVLWADRWGADRERCAETRQTIDARLGPILAALRRVASTDPDIRVADAIPVFCDTAMCRPFDDGGILFKDADHLTDRGADKLYAGLHGDFEWAFGREEPDAVHASAACCTR